MSEQREKPGGTTIEQLNVTLGRPADAGGYCSGNMIENFREGWACRILANHKVAHYFERVDLLSAAALCGVDAPSRWLYGPGNFPHCARCSRAYANRERARKIAGVK